MSEAALPHAATLVAALALAAVYALRRNDRHDDAAGHASHESATRPWISAAAGVSVAYVFVELLPELAVFNSALAPPAEGGVHGPFAQRRVYVIALLAFVVTYALEHYVLIWDASPGNRGAGYRLRVGGFAAYSGLIGYLLVEHGERGAAALAWYVLAMGVHFVIVDHALAHEHGDAYRRRGRFLLAAAVPVGWLLAVVAPLPQSAVAWPFAALAGGIVMTSLRAELPDDRQGRFWPFCGAAVLFAVLLSLA